MEKTPDPKIIKFAPKASDNCANSIQQNAYQRGIDVLKDGLAAFKADEPTLNDLESKSIRALVSYVAFVNGLDEAVISSLVDDAFMADGIQTIHQADYDRVVAYLVDLDPRMVVN